jgi:hypothetical protein
MLLVKSGTVILKRSELLASPLEDCVFEELKQR